MSECVVRMEMPENCTCCPMCFTADVQGYHWCAALEQEVEEGLSRPKECPIICQLPEGHGRLVDADALMAKFEKAEHTMEKHGMEYSCSFLSMSQEISTEWYCVEDMLDNAPTIVPAERSET